MMDTFDILIVDDDPKWSQPFADNLETVPLMELAGRPRGDMTIETVTNQQDADEAIAQRQSQGRDYDLILLDLKYPRLPGDRPAEDEYQGMQWLSALRRLQTKAAIVILSAYAHGNELRDAVRAVRDFHADDFIPKTAAFGETVSRIFFACKNAERRRKQAILQRELISLAPTWAARAYAEDVASLIHNARLLFHRIAGRLETGDPSTASETPEIIRARSQSLVNDFERLTEMMDRRIGLGSRDKTEFDIANLVRSTLFTYEPWFDEAGVILTGPAEDQILMRTSYMDDLRVVLYEIIKNSVESLEMSAQPPGMRRLTVTVEVRSRNRAERVPPVIVTIHDNGDGISDAAMEHLFERGFTARDKKKHQGVGLYVARRMMAAAGGDIAVKNRAQDGAEVQLTIRDLS
ncbi:MAG: hybrid sensor histidine kinase/response regulator [Phycisphaerales bacterium]